MSTHILRYAFTFWVLTFLSLTSTGNSQRAPLDPSHNVGVETCRDCHGSIVDSWERSSHATAFSTLANSAAAAQMAQFIGIKPASITTNASCVRCHFTQEKLASAVQTTAAVSCESCHGGAEQWIDVHNSKSHSRKERIDMASALGMNHPATVYATAKACFECHVVDDEQLVNKAGHPALSPGFELLSWYSGEVKHNFLISKEGKPVKSNGHEQQEIPAPRKRMIFLTGKMLQLAHSLRAVGCSMDAPVDKAGKLVLLPNGLPTFAVQHAQTVQRVLADMRGYQAKLSIPEYAQAIGIADSVPLSTGHCEELAGAAKEIERLAEQFAKNNDGGKFAALDEVIANLHPPEQKATKTKFAER